MSFYRYLEDCDVHVVDCAGTVDLEIGLERLKVLERELDSRAVPGKRRKLLIDFRNTVWKSEEVHRQLSVVTRRDFGLNDGNANLRAAILNNRWLGQVSENERWFDDDGDALEWLKRS